MFPHLASSEESGRGVRVGVGDAVRIQIFVRAGGRIGGGVVGINLRHLCQRAGFFNLFIQHLFTASLCISDQPTHIASPAMIKFDLPCAQKCV